MTARNLCRSTQLIARCVATALLVSVCSPQDSAPASSDGANQSLAPRSDMLYDAYESATLRPESFDAYVAILSSVRQQPFQSCLARVHVTLAQRWDEDTRPCLSDPNAIDRTACRATDLANILGVLGDVGRATRGEASFPNTFHGGILVQAKRATGDALWERLNRAWLPRLQEPLRC